MSFVMEATGLGKQYGRRWALRDCTLAIPAGRIVGLVGPNGAGKTTLLHLAVGLLTPTSGSIRVLGANLADGPVQLGRVGFVAQDTPVYARLTVAQHLRMGAWLNPSWDTEMADGRIEQLGLDLRQRARMLSAASVPSSRSLWQWRRDQSASSSMSPSRASTRLRGASSFAASWKLSLRNGSASCSPPT
jgi:ABC-type multidrug transport system ATPase subunit